MNPWRDHEKYPFLNIMRIVYNGLIIISILLLYRFQREFLNDLIVTRLIIPLLMVIFLFYIFIEEVVKEYFLRK